MSGIGVRRMGEEVHHSKCPLLVLMRVVEGMGAACLHGLISVTKAETGDGCRICTGWVWKTRKYMEASTAIRFWVSTTYVPLNAPCRLSFMWILDTWNRRLDLLCAYSTQPRP